MASVAWADSGQSEGINDNSLYLTAHAAKRSQQRAIRVGIIDFVLNEADQERHVGGGCRSYWISQQELARLRKAGRDNALLERASNIVVIVHPEDGAVITAMHGYSRRARSEP
ncbi:MAG: hypothetical protein QF894_09150 [Alphaproteobacteria bacterium]|nr:hypothetical protein [Alphaproteobacteria bacterium]